MALKDDCTAPSISSRLMAAAAAGFTASFVSLPFDMIKSRLQDRSNYRGPIDAATKIIKNVCYYLSSLMIFLFRKEFWLSGQAFGRTTCDVPRTR